MNAANDIATLTMVYDKMIQLHLTNNAEKILKIINIVTDDVLDNLEDAANNKNSKAQITKD